MSAWLLHHEATVRAALFLATLGLLAFLQRRHSLRGDARRGRRQAVNLGLIVLGTLLLRALVPVAAVGWAAWCQQRGVGLLAALPVAETIRVLVAVLLLDLAIYWQHRLFHVVPALWRLHRVHHSDTGFDVSTGVRFHPGELALSLGIKLAVIAALGAPPIAVLLFEALLSCGALFTHADLALPARLDRALRTLLVTPSMHRIHHSCRRLETDSNYGFHLSVWDRLFGSYRARAIEPEARMCIGLARWREEQDQGLLALLRQPFERAPR
ncbi:MAG: fatty acid hydroxylase [Lysobacteraceae bacterium]|nr:MAG: fatty acid hydroxylase [Xanthomonadaceae bacterium]